MRLSPPALLFAAAVACVGCRTTEVRRPFVVAREAALVRTAPPSGLWNVVEDGELRGTAVLFEGEVPHADTTYVVRNAWGQDLGLVDGLGRAWRFTPHGTEADWVGTGSVLEGVASILRRRPERLELLPETTSGPLTGPGVATAQNPSGRGTVALEKTKTPDAGPPR